MIQVKILQTGLQVWRLQDLGVVMWITFADANCMFWLKELVACFGLLRLVVAFSSDMQIL